MNEKTLKTRKKLKNYKKKGISYENFQMLISKENNCFVIVVSMTQLHVVPSRKQGFLKQEERGTSCRQLNRN